MAEDDEEERTRVCAVEQRSCRRLIGASDSHGTRPSPHLLSRSTRIGAADGALPSPPGGGGIWHAEGPGRPREATDWSLVHPYLRLLAHLSDCPSCAAVTCMGLGRFCSTGQRLAATWLQTALDPERIEMPAGTRPGNSLLHRLWRRLGQ